MTPAINHSRGRSAPVPQDGPGPQNGWWKDGGGGGPGRAIRIITKAVLVAGAIGVWKGTRSSACHQIGDVGQHVGVTVRQSSQEVDNSKEPPHGPFLAATRFSLMRSAICPEFIAAWRSPTSNESNNKGHAPWWF
ncbi:hypothetical protein VTK56DRAFT_452 [Thermocarpiscus australiensis]